MLAAAQRLRRSSDFAVAIRGGRRAARGAVAVHLSIPGSSSVPAPSQGDAEIESTIEPVLAITTACAGFVVSKAVGNAVVRNTVRRRLRHLVRERIGELPAGATLVVRALPEAARTSYRQMGLDLDLALKAAARPPRTKRREGAG